MKKLFAILATVLITATLWAQSPEKMSYQAVIRDASDNLVTDQSVGMQISILQGSASGTPVYVEAQTPTTNANGLVSIEIGTGTVESGDFTAIDWTAGPYFIKTETDPLTSGGTNYTITGTSQLLSVPYALHAKTADTLTGAITETDPVFDASVASDITGTDTINWNNKLDTEVDGSVTNELQVLSISNDTIYLTDGGFVELPAGFDGQYSSLTGAPTNVSSFTNDAGYLDAETDPVYSSSVASGITGTNTTNWNNKQDQLTAGTGIDITGNTISATTYSVGDFAQGGIVFWVDETGQHGLVAAKEDQDGGSGIQWYNGSYTDTEAHGDGVYAGEMNTMLIIANQGSNSNDYAAGICANYTVTESGVTYGDWYLPSTEELNLMYQNKATIDATAGANGGSGFASAYYWSSTEVSNYYAWLQYFVDGSQGSGSKLGTDRVRAVRAF